MPKSYYKNAAMLTRTTGTEVYNLAIPAVRYIAATVPPFCQLRENFSRPSSTKDIVFKWCVPTGA
jgi:hypothetical protein